MLNLNSFIYFCHDFVISPDSGELNMNHLNSWKTKFRFALLARQFITQMNLCNFQIIELFRTMYTCLLEYQKVSHYGIRIATCCTTIFIKTYSNQSFCMNIPSVCNGSNGTNNSF